MLFPTTDFAIFFTVTFAVGWLLAAQPTRWKLAMLAASYVFYGWWDWRFVFLLAANTLISYLGAEAIRNAATERARRGWLIGAVAAELGLLGWFKYYGFLSLNVADALHQLSLGSPLPLLQVILPVGISFFTFMGLSYLIDVYRRQLDTAALLDVATYLSFFPHLVAGPIVRGGELLPQLRARRIAPLEPQRAAWLIFAGLFKKVVLSSYIATAIVDPVFASPAQHSSLEILFAVYGYAVQIYCDFSGYTDIAIGLALLLGIRFPDNFNAPYTALSQQDFWRRWHMTLSRWLRDYLYIPLGGSRGSALMTDRNIMITMLLGGLWHGASWTFVVWGGLLGLGQVVGHRRRAWRVAHDLPALPEGRAVRVRQRVLTFNYVCLGWVFFRASSLANALEVLHRLVTGFGPAPLVSPAVLGVIALGIGMQYVPNELPARVQAAFGQLGPIIQGGVLGVALLVITTLGPQGVAPFIYYRF